MKIINSVNSAGDNLINTTAVKQWCYADDENAEGEINITDLKYFWHA